MSPNFAMGRKGYKPDMIVIHIMAGTLKSTDTWFSMIESQVSSHYGVGLNGEIHQYVHEEDTAWANGLVPGWNTGPTSKFVLSRPGVNPNLYSISIEHEGQDLSKNPKEQLEASANLIKDICTRYNIPIDRNHIIGHYEIKPAKPNCPATDKSILDTLILMAKDPMVKIDVRQSMVDRVLIFIKNLK